MADPDLQIKGGPSHPDPDIREGAVSKKIFSVWSKNKGGGRRVPRAPSLNPPLHFENDENRPVAPTRLGRL